MGYCVPDPVARHLSHSPPGFLPGRPAFSSTGSAILGRLVPEDLTGAWHRYLTFAIYVVGISGGVRIWSLEQYILPRAHDQPALTLTPDRWTFEVFRTIIGTLQSLAWLLLVFFVFALVAYVVVRGLEMRRQTRAT